MTMRGALGVPDLYKVVSCERCGRSALSASPSGSKYLVLDEKLSNDESPTTSTTPSFAPTCRIYVATGSLTFA